jgi:adenosylcobinamide-GDP ribazoletransferase
VSDGPRLALALLTILPVGAVRHDRATAAAAMLFAPLVGVLLAGCLLVVGWWGTTLGLSPPLIAALCVAALAGLTRGLHLDGLADTADGLGSGRPAAQALAVMRRSDIGPFGVLTMVLVLVLQIVAAADVIAEGAGWAAALAVVVGRLVLPLACRRGVPAARADGLGATVVGAVPTGAAAGCVLTGLVAVAAFGGGFAGAGAAALGLVGALVLLARCVRRLGGVTGDVLGAAVEVTQTVYVVSLAALLDP